MDLRYSRCAPGYLRSYHGDIQRCSVSWGLQGHQLHSLRQYSYSLHYCFSPLLQEEGVAQT